MLQTLTKFVLFLSLPYGTMASAASLSPAQQSMARAQELIAKEPNQISGYNMLAMAAARRARETSDIRFYDQGEKALEQSFRLKPGNFEGMKVKTWLLLGRHEFARALEVAQQLNKQLPDDVTIYGYLADANAELGNYDAAEQAAQWMLKLRPGNVPGLTRGAYLRELWGDLSGALEFMQMAYDSTGTTEFEDRAWILTQMAHIHLQIGDATKAELYANGALSLFGGYHYALGVLGKIRMAQKRWEEAATFFEQQHQRAPHAENLYVLAQALKAGGRNDESKRTFRQFEEQSARESRLADNSNHELVAYYCDEAKRPADALRLAKEELERRHDVHTLDALAWALHCNNDDRGAAAHIQRAVAVGVKDPQILYHAGVIEAGLGHRDRADQYLRDAAHRYSTAAADKLSSLEAKLPESTR